MAVRMYCEDLVSKDCIRSHELCTSVTVSHMIDDLENCVKEQLSF